MAVYRNDSLGFFEEAMNSLYEQTLGEFDIYIQCDGYVQPDVEKYLDREYQKRKIFSLGKRKENRGFAFSLNEMLEKILKKDYMYIVRMDSDDISVSDRIEKQYFYMEKNIDINVCGGLIKEFNMDTHIKQLINYPENSNEILQGMKKRNSVAHVTTFFRKDFFEKVGLYDTNSLNEDFNLWLRGFENGCNFYNIQDVLVRVRTNDAFFNRRKNIKRAKEVMLLKINATKTFSFGISGYIYAFAHFLLFMSPGFIKQIFYKHLR